jgi:hypothetical protein
MGDHADPHAIHVVGPNFGLVRPFNAILDSTVSSWPKTDYIYPLGRFHDGAVEKHGIHEMDLKNLRIGGETLPEPLLVPLWLHCHHLLQQHDEEGVIQPLDYGVVEVTCIKLSLMLNRLESHDLRIMIVTIFVLTMWWILCLSDDLWDAKMFMFLMY